MESQSISISAGTISGSSSHDLLLEMTTADVEDSASWSVQVSENSDGSDPTTCSGSTTITLSGTAPDTTPPEISDVVISEVTDSSVKVQWTTNESSDSMIEYGVDESFGGAKSDTTHTTSHSFTIPGLSANTTYVYNLKSMDDASNTGESGNNTFVTAKVGSTGTTQTGSSSSTTTTRIVTPTPTPIPDTTAPNIKFTTKLAKSYPTAPALSGTATDPSGVGKVSYSVDGGVNWIAVDELKSPGKTSVAFTFTPNLQFDDSYPVRIKAWDDKGNAGVLSAGILVIDRLPPQVSAVFLSSGPLELTPNEQGVIPLVDTMDIKVTLSSVGGPTETSINFISESGKPMFETPVHLSKNSQSGLWSTTLRIDGAGPQTLVSQSIDGAENKATRELSHLYIYNPGRILADDGAAVQSAKIRVFKKDASTNQFQPWDGTAYGIGNPFASKNGRYSVMLPAGTYYLEVSQRGYHTNISTVFRLQRATPVHSDIRLERQRTWNIGGFAIVIPNFSRRLIRVGGTDNAFVPGNLAGINHIGSPFPQFQLPLSTGVPMTDLQLRGKPTLLTLLTPWHPISVSQIAQLEQAKSEDSNTVVVLLEESLEGTKLYKKRIQATIPFLSDIDGILVQPLDVSTIPMHVFINRKGSIEAVRIGWLSVQEIRSMLSD